MENEKLNKNEFNKILETVKAISTKYQYLQYITKSDSNFQKPFVGHILPDI